MQGLPAVSITINGEMVLFAGEPTIRDVLERLKAPPGAVAVEVNRTIVPRRAHDSHVLREGDEVEVVTFVGGG